MHAEISRRGVQQKARKAQRKAAHQKHVARVMAKKFLNNARFNSLSHLGDMGLLNSQLDSALHEDVLPWLFNHVEEFIAEDKSIVFNAYEVAEMGIRGCQHKHANKLDEIKKAKEAKEQAARDFQMAEDRRKHIRRLQREKREKDQNKAAFKELVLKEIVDKGEIRQHAAHTEFCDMFHGHENKHIIGAYGGFFQQAYFVVASVMELFANELQAYYTKKQETPGEVNRATNAIELTLEQYFVPFLVNYLKDLVTKCEAVTFTATPEIAELLEEFGIKVNPQGFYELAKMTREQAIQFRNLFVEKRMCNEDLMANKNEKAMDLMLSTFC